MDLSKIKSTGSGKMSPGKDKVGRGGMELYNTEYQHSRERGKPYNLKPDGIKATTLTGQRQDGAPGASSVRKTATSGKITVTAGAGRARGVNTWYPNKGIIASADSGESQRRGTKESESRGTSGDMDKG